MDRSHNLFFISSEKRINNEVIIGDVESHHIKNVLRKKNGDEIFLTDGVGNRYKAVILQVKKSLIKAKIHDKKHIEKQSTYEIDLAFVPIKGLRNEFIIQKGTELGINKFIIFVSKKSLIKDLSKQKLGRFKKIAISAILQSRQYYMPAINFKKNLNDLAEQFGNYELIILADTNGSSDVPLGAKRILYILGPEGGFDDKEINFFKRNGARLLSLGPNRLRSETAAIVGVTKILVGYGLI